LNPAPNNQAPGSGAPYPPPAQHPGYAPYGPYYPYYPYAPYPAYYVPWYPPQPLVQPPTPVERAASPRVGRVIRQVLGVVLALVTLGSVALAAAGQSSAQLAPSPASVGYTLTYSSRSANDQNQWDGSTCVLEQGGLHARELPNAPSLCAFRPSESQDVTSLGFFLDAVVGPAAAVPSEQEPCVVLRNASSATELSLTFDQQGNYVLDTAPAGTDCSLSSSTGLPVTTGTFAWHTDGEVANRISLLYMPNADQNLILYVNGQQVAQTTWNTSGFDTIDTINLGAAAGGEAVFTSFALYTKQ
jgi:hypothetical protein